MELVPTLVGLVETANMSNTVSIAIALTLAAVVAAVATATVITLAAKAGGRANVGGHIGWSLQY